MEAGHYISISSRRNGREWHVRLKYTSGDLNSLDYTVSETKHHSKKAATKKADTLARAYNARILGEG